MSIVAHAQQRIIGGSTANITERPYQAAVFVDGDFEGGGVIISNRWILTAAHVVDGHSYSDIEVYFGSTNLNNASSVTARRVIVHEDYNDDLQTQDIALIELHLYLLVQPDKLSRCLQKLILLEEQLLLFPDGDDVSGLTQIPNLCRNYTSQM